ncbi:kelch repeat-containing protein [Streptomyces sp. NPDC048332]|uniref:kelch repeat-containing protein n=1 Tax=Streptomyces sp. NPDC048332 TaxID=3154619 RepID=UPI0034213284
MRARRWRRSARAAVVGSVAAAVVAALGVAGPAAQAFERTVRVPSSSADVPAAADTSVVTGKVSDGSGHGWPLYAKITVTGGPGGEFHTDPVTGRYEIALPEGASYQLKFEPDYPGYETVTRDIDLGADDVTRDVGVPVDASTCTANGYRYTYTAAFDDGALPANWTVTDLYGDGGVWRFDDSHNRGNRSGGEGGFATADSNYFGAGNRQDTVLTTAVTDLGAFEDPVIVFNQDFYYRSGEVADVDLSLDGGRTWTNVLRQTGNVRGPRFTTIPIPQAVGASQAQVRFHYYNANFDGWWQLDNVAIGGRTCDPTAGGAYLTGNVTDANTGLGLDRALVAAGEVSVKTAPTPDDPALPDGFYSMFTEKTGTQDVTATADGYLPATVQTDVGGVTRADFGAKAGRLDVTPSDVTAQTELGERSETRPITVTNTGTAPAEVRLGEGRDGFVMRRADGETLTRHAIETAEGAPLQRLDVPVSLAATGNADGAAAVDGPSADPWTGIANYPQNIMDNRVVTLDGKIYSVGGSNGSGGGGITAGMWVYDPAALAWTRAAPLPEARAGMTVGVVDGRIVAASGWAAAGPSASTWVYEPLEDRWTAAAGNPVPRAAAGQAVLDGRLYAVGGCTTAGCTPTASDVLAYDPEQDTWETLADYPLAVAFPSCGALDGQVVCTGGNDGTAATNRTYAYDPDSGTWSRRADAPSSVWGASHAVAGGELVVASGVQDGTLSNAAHAYDPATGTWHALPNAGAARYRGGAACGFYKIGGSTSGYNAGPVSEMLPGFGQCDAGEQDAEWMSLDKAGATLAPGESLTVRVTMDARVDQPGTYSGSVRIRENTPYATPSPVPVTMTVTPPRSWGKLVGTVNGVACDATEAPLPGATVTVRSPRTTWTFTTGADGAYAHWIDGRDNPFDVYASKDGYRPQGRQVRIKGRSPTTADFDLARVGC